jgi:hypothetical protein
VRENGSAVLRMKKDPGCTAANRLFATPHGSRRGPPGRLGNGRFRKTVLVAIRRAGDSAQRERRETYEDWLVPMPLAWSVLGYSS